MAQVLQDVKEDGTAYPRQQPKPALAPVRPLGVSTPMYGEPQAPNIAPVGGPMVNPQAPQAQRNPALPPKTNLPTEDQPSASGGPMVNPPAPQTPTGPQIPPPPPPVGTVGGPMVNPGVPGAMQTPPAQPPVPGTPAVTMPFGPGQNDLRYQNIFAQDPRLAGTQGQVDTARDTLSSTPDRTELAAQALQLLRERTQAGYEQDQRSIGQSAAKFGRIGAGMTTNELTDLNLTRERDLDRSARELANQAAGSTMSDRLARVSALSGLEGQQFGQGQAGRDEIRGERGYQNEVDQRARDEERQRLLLEDSLLNSQFGREQSRASLLGQLGFGQDPTGTLMGQGGYYGDMAGESGAGAADLLRLWYEQQAGLPATTSAPAPTAARPVARPPVSEDDLLVGPGRIP